MHDSPTPPGSSARCLCYWHRGKPRQNNFGDVLNPLLIATMTGARVTHYDDAGLLAKAFRPVLFAAGSILERDKRSMRSLRSRIHVWGTGTRGEQSLGHLARARIHAVRGPLTRRRLREHGIACPEVYGDPGTLMARHFPQPAVPREHVAVMPHYVDRQACAQWIAQHGLEETVQMIDVLAPVQEVLAAINRARCVLSTAAIAAP